MMLKWTSVPPTEEGWYWWKAGPASVSVEVVEVKGKIAFFSKSYQGLHRGARTLQGVFGEWWSAPIAPPQEEE